MQAFIPITFQKGNQPNNCSTHLLKGLFFVLPHQLILILRISLFQFSSLESLCIF